MDRKEVLTGLLNVASHLRSKSGLGKVLTDGLEAIDTAVSLIDEQAKPVEKTAETKAKVETKTKKKKTAKMK